MNSKLKLVRVVTQAEVVPWHLKNFIDRSANDYDLYIIGNKVTKYSHDYNHVTFIDCQIQRKTSIYYDLKALLHLIIIFIKIKPKIIHSIMPKAGLLAAIAGFITLAPIRIHTFTGQVWSTKTGISRSVFKFVDRVILTLNTKCLTDSPSQSQFLAENGFLNNGKVLDYLGRGSLSGVALNRFDINIVNNRNVLRYKLGINDSDFVYVFLARKSVVKGIIELFESFSRVAHLPNTKLLFIGPDESDGILTELFTKYEKIQDKIISLDIVLKHEDYIAISDVLCLPSSSEGFGSVVIEAAALGIPTIGFEIVGLTDAIDNNETGILVPFKNVDKFSEAMLNLYNDKELLNNMKIKCRKRIIDYFSADVVYNFQKDFYKSIL